MKDDSQYPYPILRFEADKDLFEEVKRTGQPVLRVYHPEETMVVLGRSSKPDVELHVDRILLDEVPIYRRPGGGCSVVLDEGNVVVAVVLPAPGLTKTKEWFDRCTQWMIDSLAKAGFDGVRKAGISDLAIGEHKIAGSAVYRAKDIFYYAVTILVNPDLSLFPRYLTHPPREPDYREGRDHLDFVVALRDEIGLEDPADFECRLNSSLDIQELLEMGDL
jgi:lipoate---protein ligase